MNDPQQLVEAYFDRGLTPEETVQLRGWLAASEENRRSFAHDAMLYLGLPDALHESAVSEEISDMALLRSLETESAESNENFLEALQSLSPDDEQLPVVDITTRVMQEVAQARYEARRAKAMQQAQKEAGASKEVKPAGIPAWAIYGGAIAACLALALMVFRPAPPATPTPQPPVAEQADPFDPGPANADPRAVAKVLSSVRALGADGLAFQDEKPLYRGEVEIETGLVQLEFENGAVVTVQGPARLRLLDEGRVALDSGELFARSDAGQFVVETPRGIVTDLGTSFGVAVAEGRLEAHTFEGRIEVLRTDLPGQAAVALRAGGALSIDDQGVQAMQADTLRFVGEDEYAVHRRAEQGDAEARWIAAAYELRHHPAMVLYLSPDLAHTTGAASSMNLAELTDPNGPRQRGSASDDSLTDMIQRRRALVFDQASDRLVYQVTETYQALTLSAWISLGADQPRNGLHALVMADGDSAGDLHWQLDRQPEGLWTARLGCFDAVSQEGHYIFQDMDVALPQVPTPGQWVHVTTTINVSQGMMRTYINGDLIGSNSLTRSDLVRLGQVHIGNWNPIPEAGTPERYLDGAISDLAIFAVTLSGQEVKELYETTVRP